MSNREVTAFFIGMGVSAFIALWIVIALGEMANKRIISAAINARIEVASGQVKCELITQADKTTEWVCEKT